MLKVKDLQYGDKFIINESGVFIDVMFIGRKFGYCNFTDNSENVYLIDHIELNKLVVRHDGGK